MWAKILVPIKNCAGTLFAGDHDCHDDLKPLKTISHDIAGSNDDLIFNLDLDGDSPMKSLTPTHAQITELVNNTTQQWTTVNGVEGVRFTALNGNSIFLLPVTGYRK